MWMDYLVKGEMRKQMCAQHLREIRFCAYGQFLLSFISAHETNTLHVAFIFLFREEKAFLPKIPLVPFKSDSRNS